MEASLVDVIMAFCSDADEITCNGMHQKKDNVISICYTIHLYYKIIYNNFIHTQNYEVTCNTHNNNYTR